MSSQGLYAFYHTEPQNADLRIAIGLAKAKGLDGRESGVYYLRLQWGMYVHIPNPILYTLDTLDPVKYHEFASCTETPKTIQQTGQR